MSRTAWITIFGCLSVWGFARLLIEPFFDDPLTDLGLFLCLFFSLRGVKESYQENT